MAKESAKEFAEKMFTDDEFVKEFYKKGGINRKASNDEKNEILMKAAKEMEYDFTLEEYKDANATYFKGLGLWNTIKKFWHFNKVVKKEERKSKKNK